MKNNFIKTPAYVLDEKSLIKRLTAFQKICDDFGLVQLFPIKTHNSNCALEIISNSVNGFAASSLFEAQLAHELVKPGQKIHFTSPGLRVDEASDIAKLCDAVSFSSFSQWQRMKHNFIGDIDCALRINPQLSFVEDSRYDPCRENSRLGIPLDVVKQLSKRDSQDLEGVNAVHFHTNCDSERWEPLLITVKKICDDIPGLLMKCKWVNLGGGYLLSEETDLSPLLQSIKIIKQVNPSLDVIIEPGAAVIRDSVSLITTVIDLVESGTKQIAILDTTVNHLPEVFEYSYKHDLAEEVEGGAYEYILEGGTCLAGDHFGCYAFDKPLKLGQKIHFSGVGAYSHVKAHMFNGVNLPSIYRVDSVGDVHLEKSYTYDDFRSRCGA